MVGVLYRREYCRSPSRDVEFDMQEQKSKTSGVLRDMYLTCLLTIKILLEMMLGLILDRYGPADGKPKAKISDDEKCYPAKTRSEKSGDAN